MRIFWINLDERTDRQKEIEEEMKHFPATCTFERISAIKYSPGYIGCSMSHIKALEKAMADDLPYVCIVEDDMQLMDGCNQIKEIEEYINSNWNVIILGAIPKNQTYKRKNKNMIVAKNMQTTIGYIVNKSYYNKLLNNFKTGLKQLLATNAHWHYAIDQYWKKLQEEDEWLCVFPYLIKQRESYSSIENNVVNYDEYYNYPINIVE